MLGHRKLNNEDYLAIFKRRRWLILVPTIVLPLLAFASTYVIPAKYQSQTLVLIEEQKVPDDYVKPVISSDLDSRLASMREQILSRSRIQPIIDRYNLYGSQHMTMDDRIDLARKNIAIKPIHSEIPNARGLPGFFISFIASDARTAQLVCGEITSLFLSENLKSREDTAQGTTDFLKGQLEEAKRGLDEQDSKLAAFQRQYSGKLPGEEAPNLNMLTSLNTQLEAATQALSRLQQDKAYVESMLAQQRQVAAPVNPLVPESSAPPAEQMQLQALLAQEADLNAHYTADYPDVIAIHRKIADLRREMAKNAPVANGGTRGSAPKTESLAVQQLMAQVRALDSGIDAKRREQAQIQGEVRMYQDRISSSPMVQEQYKELTRDYQTAQTFYDDLLKKMNQSKMATDLERRQEGEQFRVMDQPNLPESPTFPNPVLFTLGGLAAGLTVGLAMAAFLEYKDTTLRIDRDIWAFTQLPTLAVIAYTGQDGHHEPAEKPRRWKLPFRTQKAGTSA